MDNQTEPSSSEGSTHTLYYRNFMNNKYKEDEQALKKILKNNIKMKNEHDRLKVVVYYKNLKSKNFIMRNNMMKKPRELSRTNVIYHFNAKKVTVSTFTTVERHTVV